MVVRKDYSKYKNTLLAPMASFIIKRETKLLQRVRDIPCCPRLVSADDKFSFTMEYIDGENIRESVRHGARVKFHDMLKAINMLHRNDIIHNDIRGANILVDRQGRIFIVDFASAIIIPRPLRFLKTRLRCLDLASALKIKKKLLNQPLTQKELKIMRGRKWLKVMQYIWKQHILRLFGRK
ncbi:kinase [Azotobacter armeniacus]